MAGRPLSSRARFVIAACVATLPLVALVAYAAVDRYEADRDRATLRASTRSQLYSTLLAGQGGRPSQAALNRLLELAPLTVTGGVVDLLDGSKRVVASSGTGHELPPASDPRVAAALARSPGTFKLAGPGGAEWVWGVAPVEGSDASVVYGVAGSDVYGASRAALERDLGLAVLAAAAAIGSAFLLAGRVTAPIRRLAAQVGGESRADDLGTLEHGIQRLDAAIAESQAELARRADELERLNAELRERERDALRLATIVESSGDAIFSEKLDGTIMTWNAGAEALYGYSAQEILGSNVAVLVPSERLEEIPVILGEIGKGKAVDRRETERIRRDGTRFQVALTVSPLHGQDGEIVGASTIARDISEQKAAEDQVRQLNEELEERVRVRTAQLEDANRELEAFSYSVSHDLRAPLRAIDGFSRIVLDEHAAELDAEGRRYLEQVGKSTQDMASLIDGLLAFSRLSQLPLDRRRVDVEALAHEAADSLDAGNGSAHAIAIGHLPAARADPTLLRQVFANLLSNAVKFTRDEPDPRIEVGSYADNGSAVYVVRDNGVGFDMRHADKIFTVFQRLHRQEDYEGTGIGLALVARIVARHGGRIWADASPGEGAAFHFTLDGSEA